MNYDSLCTCDSYGYTPCEVKYHRCMCRSYTSIKCLSNLHECCCYRLVECNSDTSKCLFLGLHECICIQRNGRIGKKCLNVYHRCCCHIDQQSCLSGIHNCSCNKSNLSIETNSSHGCRKSKDHKCSCKTDPNGCRHKKCPNRIK